MLKVASIGRSSPGDWLKFVRAYIWLFRAKRLMKRAKGSQWLTAEQRPAGEPVADSRSLGVDRALIKQRVAAISRASRYPRRWAFCLQQSLALREWLASDGIFTEVRYGVRKVSDRFDAHAWVVHDGKIVNDSVQHISTFAPLRSFDEYGGGSRGDIQSALVTSRVESEAPGKSA